VDYRGNYKYLHFRVIWCNAKADQSIWHWQRFIHVHMSISELGKDSVGGVETRGTGADDSETKGTIGSLGLLRDG
jgi:hypothetical protein